MGPERVIFRTKPGLVEAMREGTWEWGVPLRRMNGGETCAGSPGLPGYAEPCSSSKRRIHRRTVERSTFWNRSIGTELCSTFD